MLRIQGRQLVDEELAEHGAWFHDSTVDLPTGTVLVPGRDRGIDNFPPGGDSTAVFLTPRLKSAASWAAQAAGRRRWRVYAVLPAVDPLPGNPHRDEWRVPTARGLGLVLASGRTWVVSATWDRQVLSGVPLPCTGAGTVECPKYAILTFRKCDGADPGCEGPGRAVRAFPQVSEFLPYATRAGQGGGRCWNSCSFLDPGACPAVVRIVHRTVAAAVGSILTRRCIAARSPSERAPAARVDPVHHWRRPVPERRALACWRSCPPPSPRRSVAQHGRLDVDGEHACGSERDRLMSVDDPADALDRHFREAVAGLPTHQCVSGHVDAQELHRLFAAQAGSRHLDFAARRLGARGLGFYSIGSAGHESNAAVAAALRPTDPALLHYRSGGFYLRRAAQVPGQDPVRDVLLGVVASAEEPIAGGRHKVYGSRELSVVPQTSTISSHLPRAVGLAFALGRTQRLGLSGTWPADSVVVCSFGDASVNHSTFTGAVNAALHSAYQAVPMPLLLVCEDNGLGISVRTPHGWVETTYCGRAGLAWFAADGSDPAECLDVSARAADWVRSHRAPAFLHLRTVRYLGHAGSDVESGYRSRPEILRDYARDPLLGTARLLVATGACSTDEVLATYDRIAGEVARVAEEVLERPRLRTAAEVMAPIATEHREQVARRVRAVGESGPVPERPAPQQLTLAQAVNRSLAELLEADDRVLVFGQDVGRKGGVYGVTRGLHRRFGGTRVFDTLLDEQSILGTALGLGLQGFTPVPEVQYLAYLHNAADQLRGEAATLGFFSRGAYRNPLVLRVASYAYQKGFGGHFHNDDSVAALRDIPGVVVASPARPDDAAAMLRTCVAAAEVDGRVCVFLEPIALYHRRDLYDADDGRWLASYPDPRDPATHVPVGSARVHGDGGDLTMVTFGNGLAMSLRVARTLAARGVKTRVLDLRWLTPLPREDLLSAAEATGRVLVVDETRRSGGVSESVVAGLVDGGFRGRVARVTSEDSFVPLGAAAGLVLLDETTIERAALALVGEGRGAAT